MKMQRNIGPIRLFSSSVRQKDRRRRITSVRFLAATHPCTLALVVALAGSLHLAAQSSTVTPIYLDKTQPIEARVDDLMRRMMLKEKVGQLNLPCGYVDALGKQFQRRWRRRENLPPELIPMRLVPEPAF
jgi:hypothetical protein